MQPAEPLAVRRMYVQYLGAWTWDVRRVGYWLRAEANEQDVLHVLQALARASCGALLGCEIDGAPFDISALYRRPLIGATTALAWRLYTGGVQSIYILCPSPLLTRLRPGERTRDWAPLLDVLEASLGQTETDGVYTPLRVWRISLTHYRLSEFLRMQRSSVR